MPVRIWDKLQLPGVALVTADAACAPCMCLCVYVCVAPCKRQLQQRCLYVTHHAVAC